MSRIRRVARTVLAHPSAAAVLIRLGVDVRAIAEEPSTARPARPQVRAHQDHPDDAAPYRRDHQQFERDRS